MTRAPIHGLRGLVRAGGLLAALACGCGPPPPSLPVPERVVILVLDSLHARHLGCYGGPEGLTPNIDGAAAGGLRFERAFSNHTWTLPSTTSLMTGQLQERHGVVTSQHVVPERAECLAELFRRAGWRTASFVQMIYASEVYGLGQGFDETHNFGFRDGPGRDLMRPRVQDWMEARQGERYLLYLHFRRPHKVYDPTALSLSRLDQGCPLASGVRDPYLSSAESSGFLELPPEERAHVEHLYRANLADADRNVGKIVKRCLDDPGTLLVITSDHGEGLGEHGYYGHGDVLFAEGIDIPLIIHGPGVRAGVDPDPACTVDVLPTLLEACGIAPPAGVPLDGRSLVARLVPRGAGAEEPEPREPIPVSSRYKPNGRVTLGYVAGELKLVVDPDGHARLFDRVLDPADGADLAAQRRELAGALRERAEAYRAAHEGIATRGAAPPALSPRDVQDLRDLGYAE